MKPVTEVVGVLSLQGDFEAHARVLRSLGAEVREVRTAADLEGLDGLVIPGGESTTMTLGIEREGLADPLRDLVAAGTPVLGTCAGMIMLDRAHLGVMDTLCARNAFGRQIRSFEADLEIPGIDGPPVRAVFIRAPWIAEHGDGVEILAEVGPPGRGPPGGAAGDLVPPGDRRRGAGARAVPARRARPRTGLRRGPRALAAAPAEAPRSGTGGEPGLTHRACG